MQRRLLFLIVFTAISLPAFAQLPQYSIAPQSAERLFCYTNKRAAFFAGAVNGQNSSGFHGITEEKQKLFEDYWIRLGDQLLDRRTAEIEMTPVGFRRRYPLYNTVEDVFFSDSLTMLSVSVHTDFRGGVKIYPGLSVWWRDAMESRKGDIYWLFKAGLQGVIAVNGLIGDWDILRPREQEEFTNPAPMHMPLMYFGKCTGTFTFTTSFLLAGLPPRNWDERSLQRLHLNRERRITELIDAAAFSCEDAATTRAFEWISASMDALVMRQLGLGIYAGLPSFDDYFVRETFISLPGAMLVTGRFEQAREVLRSFLRYMDRDTSSATYGRIPNRIQPKDMIYSTVDGTPWMVIQIWQYYRYSGDKAFLEEVFPDIERTIAGALRHTDEQLLLTHADAETWMDAVGPDGPWSPRGNRALDIQALWYAQLRAAAHIAETLGDLPRNTGWNRYADKVRSSVQELFIDTDNLRISDHLNSDNSKDLALRPNILLPNSIPGSDIFHGIADSILHPVLARVFAETVYPYGVASLSQEDSNFHPWHSAPQFYTKDAAYHNGTIWTWLTGPAVTTLTKLGMVDSAWVLTQSLQRLAMDAAAVGTIPECTDALPRDGAKYPRWSGSFLHARGNAEYLRNWYQNYLGISPSWTLDGRPVLTLSPTLPSSFLAKPGDSITVNTRVGDARIHLVYRQETSGRSVQLQHLSGNSTVRIVSGTSAPQALPAGGSLRVPYPSKRIPPAFADSLPLFARPRSTAEVPSIQPPAWPQIDGATAKLDNPKAKELCSCFDPEGDDKGEAGVHTYPANAIFTPGIADIRWFDVRSDAQNVYFTIRMRALTQPGWHPEYGFQLTQLAIAIDQTHNPALQAVDLGYNSGYTFPAGKGYDRLIIVGGGVRVTDSKGAILCEFIPEILTDAFGDVSSSEIRFAIPRAYLGGGFDHWQYTVLSGLQDDHGGSGIGEFGSVLPLATEWNGGGTAGQNWYDILRCPEK